MVKVKRKSIKKQAEDNLEVVKRSGRDSEIVKKGSHAEHSMKHLEEDTVGASIGTTLNMGDYESLRIDLWATVGIEGKTLDDAYSELFATLDEQLVKAVKHYKKD